MGGTRAEAADADRSEGRRRRAAGMVLALVLGVHAVVLERWGGAGRESEVQQHPAGHALTVRIVAAGPTADAAAASIRPQAAPPVSDPGDGVRPARVAAGSDRTGRPAPAHVPRRPPTGQAAAPTRLGRSTVPVPVPVPVKRPDAPLPWPEPRPPLAVPGRADASNASDAAVALEAVEDRAPDAPSTIDTDAAPARARPVRFVPGAALIAVATPGEPTASGPEPEPDPETEPVPHYRTRMPPSVLLRYDVRRGGLSGIGRIDWRTDGSHYDLKLDFRYLGLAILQQASSGGFDADGLAPQRFVDQRIRRAAQAANFQRGAKKLSYSGSGEEFMLRPGAQDRLSWMVQLAAIVAAEPALARPGGRITMFVTGARADIAVWTFRAVGAEPFELRSGTVETVKFVRESRHAHDISVQAWLDPARGYLPAAASQQSGPGDEPYELRLVEAVEAH